MTSRKLIHAILAFFAGLPYGTLLFAETITIGPEDDLRSVVESASDGDVICLKKGRYTDLPGINTRRNLTLIGIPFEESKDEDYIRDVVVEFRDSVANNWSARGEMIIRGILFRGGDHQFQFNNRMLVEYCIFEDGDDQVSFDEQGYGVVRNCQFYSSADDGIDIDTKTTRAGAFIHIHDNYFEGTDEDGIEFRTHARPEGSELLVYEINNNHFFHCGVGENEGDGIQLIDQRASENSREILIHHNTFDGDGVTTVGVGCLANRKSVQPEEPLGADGMKEKIWIYNNTFFAMKRTAITGGDFTYIFNNIIKDTPVGIRHSGVSGFVDRNLTHNTSKISHVAITDGGHNFFGQDPEMNLGTFELNSDSFCIDKGLALFSKGNRLIELSCLGSAPDLGACESDPDDR